MSTAPASSGQRPELIESLSWAQVKAPLLRSLLVAGALLVAGLIGVWSARSATPDSASIEAGYTRDLSAHHAQAISLSFLVRDATSSSAIRDLARNVITQDSNEAGRAEGLLSGWGLSDRPDGKRMDWMRKTGHQHAGLAKGQTLLPDGRMPGTASDAQVAALRTQHGEAAEVTYVQLLLLHDRACLDMSAAAEAASNNTPVVRLAAQDEARDRQEIAEITQFLAARGKQPWTAQQAGQPVPRP